MPALVATPELRFAVDPARKDAVVAEVRERLEAAGAEVVTVDGVRVSDADGWWLLRASGTQDMLTARAEAAGAGAVAREAGRPTGGERGPARLTNPVMPGLSRHPEPWPPCCLALDPGTRPG